MWLKNALPIDSVYVHIPFCKNVCEYCDFAKQKPTADALAYSKHVIQEIDQLAQHPFLWAPKTLYFGGGTPSLFQGELVSQISSHLSRYMDISALEEFTVEVNPSDVTPTLLSRFKEMGVTRLSMGVQSVFSSALINLGRIQRCDEVFCAGELLRESPFDLNMDLIYACPGIHLDHISESIAQLTNFRVSHISAYELTLSPSHPSFAYRPNEDAIVDQALYIRDQLAAAGLKQYEVSNYAKPGHESKHNLSYWNFKNVLGLGVSAHSSLNFKTSQNYTTNVHWTNPASLKPYTQKCTGKLHPIHIATPQSLDDTEKLFLIANLRKCAGFELTTYKTLFHQDFTHRYTTELKHLTDQGWLHCTDTHAHPTASGLLMLDSILSHLMLRG